MIGHDGFDTSLRGLQYAVGSSDLWRWVDASEDEAVGRFVSGFADLNEYERSHVRSRLGEAELDLLLTYVERCALAAVRTRDVRHVIDAFNTLSAISVDAVPDDRDLAMAAMLVTYAGQRLDHRLKKTVAPAVARAEPETAELLTEILAEHIDLVEACGYREVDSPGGRVFVEDEGEKFKPSADLITAAWVAVRLFESDGYRVDSVGIGQELSSVWLGDDRNPNAVAAAKRLTGCADVDALLPGASTWHSLVVYLAEARDDRDAAVIAAAADELDWPRKPQIGVAVGRLLAVLHAITPNVDDQPVEDAQSVERFRPSITHLLAQTPTRHRLWT